MVTVDICDVAAAAAAAATNESAKKAVATGVISVGDTDAGGMALVDNSRRHVVGVNKRKSHGCSLSDDECCGDE